MKRNQKRKSKRKPKGKVKLGKRTYKQKLDSDNRSKSSESSEIDPNFNIFEIETHKPKKRFKTKYKPKN